MSAESVRLTDEIGRLWRAKQFAEAMALLLPNAEQGDKVAQFLVASLYAKGDGVRQDEERAVHWWRKAAEQGYARAQNDLGVALSDGRGTEVNLAEAVLWYRKAAEQGMAVAQLNVGLMYAMGQGVQRDAREATGWYRLAAEQDMGWAQYYLGTAYLSGWGVRKSAREARAWLQKSAEQDYPLAQEALAEILAAGAVGVPIDAGRATYWFARAANNGSNTALAKLAAQLRKHRKIRVPAKTIVRETPDAAARALLSTVGADSLYVLGRKGGWTEVFSEHSYVTGFIQGTR